MRVSSSPRVDIGVGLIIVVPPLGWSFLPPVHDTLEHGASQQEKEIEPKQYDPCHISSCRGPVFHHNLLDFEARQIPHGGHRTVDPLIDQFFTQIGPCGYRIRERLVRQRCLTAVGNPYVER
jgi:hypothetical protein